MDDLKLENRTGKATVGPFASVFDGQIDDEENDEQCTERFNFKQKKKKTSMVVQHLLLANI
jgi:hypothetical protein